MPRLSPLADDAASARQALLVQFSGDVAGSPFAPTLYGAKLSLEALRARAATAGDDAGLRAEIGRIGAPLHRW